MRRRSLALSVVLTATLLVPAASPAALAAEPPSARSLDDVPSTLLRGELQLVADVERPGPGEQEHDHDDAGAVQANLLVGGLVVPLAPSSVDGVPPGSSLLVEVPVPAEVVTAVEQGDPVAVEADPVSGEATADTRIPAAALDAATAVPAPAESDIAAATTVAAAAAAEPVASQVVTAEAPAPETAPAGVAHALTVAVATWPGRADGGYTDSVIDQQILATSQYWSQQTGGALAFARSGAPARYTTAVTSCDFNALMAEAARKTGFTAAAGKHLVLLLPKADYTAKGCSYGLGTVGSGTSSGGMLYANDKTWTVLAHELGHNLSLLHASALKCSPLRPDAVQQGSAFTGCTVLEYGDSTNVMSGSAGGGTATGNLSVVGLDQLGVLGADASKVLTDSGTTTSSLAPLSAHTGLRALVVTDPRTRDVYYLENRQPAGRDTYGWSGGGTSSVTYGVRVLRRVGAESVLVDPTPHAQAAWYTSEDTDRTVGPGTTWTSAGGGVQVRTQAAGSSGEVSVSVSLAAADDAHWIDEVAATAITVDAVTTPPVAGTPFTLTGTARTIAKTAAKGSITAGSGGTSLATGEVGDDGRFSLTWTPTGAGASTVLLTQAAAPGEHLGGTLTVPLATSAATSLKTQLVTVPLGKAAAVAVTVTGSDGVAVTGGTLTATVQGVKRGSVSPSAGRAALSLTGLPVGTHSLALSYAPVTAAKGKVQYAPSTGTATVVVTPLASSLSGTLVTKDVSAAEQAVVTVVVKASGGPTPTGTATVSEGDVVLGSAALVAGKAAVTLPKLPAGPHALTLGYAGDSGTAASTAAGPALVVVPKPVSTIKATATKVSAGVASTLTITVTAPGRREAAGTVTVSEGGQVLASGDPVKGKLVLKLPLLAAGTHTLAITQASGETVDGGTASLVLVVAKAKPVVTGALASTTVAAGQGVELAVTATSPAGTPTGEVQLKEGATVLATATLGEGGTATLAVPGTLKVGKHTLTLAYAGDTQSLAATGKGGVLTVTKAV
ncbi:Ig-like domain repeat protein [Quadrisphaera sp. KR29]|uniref:Ig-like domain repeat protein n=1 Tax=Quadrisphaera sp. KR29 TaxID=3461391 RepID=UPI004043AF0F